MKPNASEHLDIIDKVINKEFPDYPERDALKGAGFIGLRKAADTWRVDGGAVFPHYAWVCIRNECLTQMRQDDRAGRLKPTELTIDLPARPDIDSLETADLVGWLLQDLSKAEQVYVLVRYVEGCTFRELVARGLAGSTSAAKSKADRLLARLRSKLAELLQKIE